MSEFASIFLTGEVAPGFLKEDVISALARLLKTDEQKAASLLSGRETLIKRNTPHSDVDRYLQALQKVGAVARSSQAGAPSSFPVLSETIIAPRSVPSAPAAPPPARDLHTPRELTLAPGWSDPGKATEQTAASSATVEQGTGAGFYQPTSTSGATRQRTALATREAETPPPVYADVPVFGLSMQGRIGRLRYMAYFWPTVGLLVVAGIIAALILPSMASKKPGVGILVLVVLFAVALLWMSLRVAVLRLHDLNRSGKWALLLLLVAAAGGASGSPRLVLLATAAYWILSIVLMAWPGSQDDNDYGPPAAPNTEWIYIGALLFLGATAMGIVGGMKSDKYTAKLLARSSAGASGDDRNEKQTEAMMRSYAREMDAKTPFMLSPMLSLDKVEYVDNVLSYQATIQGKGLIIGDDDMERLKASMVNTYCGQTKGGGLFLSNRIPVDFVFRYQVTAWDYDSFKFQLSPESC